MDETTAPCTLRRSSRARAHRSRRLGSGRSAAPDERRLVLLPSGPDTVHDSSLRGTRSSTSPWRAAFENGDLGREFSPAGADCRFRAPLVPRLARPSKDSRGGGEGGIRTRDGLPHTAFPVRRPRPLGDLSTGCDARLPCPGAPRCPRSWDHDRAWRRGWDSNPRCFRTPLFESGTLNHSDTSPRERIPKVIARARDAPPPRLGAGRQRSRLSRGAARCPASAAPVAADGGQPVLSLVLADPADDA